MIYDVFQDDSPGGIFSLLRKTSEEEIRQKYLFNSNKYFSNLNEILFFFFCGSQLWTKFLLFLYAILQIISSRVIIIIFFSVFVKFGK